MITDKNTSERIIYPTKAERVTVKVATTPAPWEIITPELARKWAKWLDAERMATLPDALRAYADAVDAMTAPTRLVYETAVEVCPGCSAVVSDGEYHTSFCPLQ